tara:strand:- start:2895 stop:4703 length:1809 start_codon:yes stop_codon:yes gene_type:complete
MSIYKEVKTTPLNKKHVAHKSWTITDETAANHGIISFSGQYSDGDFSISDPNESNIANEPKTSGDYFKRNIWNSVYHLYYCDVENAYKSNDSEYLSQQIRDINQKVTIVSIPSGIFGDRIKEGSVTMSGGQKGILRDDGTGNLIDHNFNGIADFKAIDRDDYIIKVDFNDGWKLIKGNPLVGTPTFRTANEHLADISSGPFEPHGENITFNIHSTGYDSNKDYGIKDTTYVDFHGEQTINSGSNSFVEIKNTQTLANNARWNSDFAVSFWVKAGVSQSVTSSFTGGYPVGAGSLPPIGTYQYRTLKDHDHNVIVTSRQWSNTVPWEINIYNSTTARKGKLRFLRGKTENFTEITSSAINDDTWHHVVAQIATGSMQLWVDGTLQTSKADPMADEIVADNTTNIHIGARRWGFKSRTYFGEVENKKVVNGQLQTVFQNVFNNKAKNYIYPFKGSMDKFKLMRRALTTPEITSLNTYYRDTNIVGNVFYNHGMLTITDVTGSYNELLNDYILNFQGTTEHTIHNYQCVVEDEQFNITYNPSARVNYDLNNERLRGFATSSEFTPYITTIGLYNDFNELLAVAKLANPVKSPSDLDIVFNVQFDT